MKRVLLFIMLSTSLLAESLDDINTSFSMDINLSTANINGDKKINFKDYNKTTSEKSSNSGIKSYQNLDLNNSTSRIKFMDMITKDIGAKGNSIVRKISDNDPDLSYNPSDINDLSSDNIRGIYTNRKRIEQLDKARDVTTRMINGYSSSNIIKCYIKRNLVPSFYCPMNGKDNSYFTGGLANTTNEDAKNKCDGYCKIQTNCVTKALSNFSKSSIEKQVTLSAPFSKTFTLRTDQVLKSLSLAVNSSLENVHVSMSISGTRNGDKVSIFNNYDIQLSKTEVLLDFKVMSKNYTSVTITMRDPYTFTTTKRKISLADNSVKLTKVSINYLDNKYWFCPSTQFVRKASQCNGGEIKNLIIGGSPSILCIHDQDRRREKTLGGYYSKETCESGCYEKQDCLPTYRNLGNSITSSVYNVSYGCTKGENNKACTKQLCKNKIYSNTIPNNETVYYNDDQKEKTVINGQTVEGTLRPTYNLSAEMNTNNNAKDKKILMVAMSKDMAYKSMMSNGTYVISAKTLNDPYDELVSATKIGNSGVSIEYVPKSNLFNTNRDSYIYFIVENIYNYKEIGSNRSASAGEQYFRSSNYTIVTAGGKQKLFYIENKKKVENVVSGNFSNYISPENISKFVGSDGTLVPYDTSSKAPVTTEKKFTSDNYRQNFLLSNNYLEYTDTHNETSLKKQVSKNGHVEKYYSGPITDSGGNVFDFKVYLLTSSSELSYQDLIDKIKSKTLKIAYSKSFSAKYTHEINGDAGIGFKHDNIRIFILGKPGNISAVGEFVPKLGEENKESFGFSFLYKAK